LKFPFIAEIESVTIFKKILLKKHY